MSPVLLVLFLIALVACLLRHARSRPPNFPPGPLRIPVWGNLWHMLLKNYRYPHKALYAMSKEFGSPVLGLFVGSFPMVVANDLDSVREMLSKTEFQGRPDTFTVRLRSFNELHGIFFTDGQFWEQQRRFSLRHLRDFGFGRRFEKLEAAVLEEVQGVVQLLKGHGMPSDQDVLRLEGGATRVLLPDVFSAASTNTVLEVLTGCRVPADLHPAARVVARHVLGFQRSGSSAGTTLDVAPWTRFLWRGGASGYNAFKGGNDGLMAFMEEHFEGQKQTFDEEMIRGFCDKYLSEMKKREGEKSSFSELQLLLTLMDYTFPAATAIPAALSFAVLLMMRHPDAAERAHREIRDCVGLDRLPTLDDRASLPYTESFLREVLRMTGTPLAVAHRCTEDTYFRGYFVPKDTLIVPNTWAAHHDPSVIAKPFDFMPERFLQPQTGLLKKKDPTTPFGLGKRLCAGETFARQNMFLFLAAMLQSFRFEMPTGRTVPDVEVDSVYGFIMSPPDDLWVEVKART